MLKLLYPNLAESAWQLYGLGHAVTVKLSRFVNLVLAALAHLQLGRKVELGYYF